MAHLWSTFWCPILKSEEHIFVMPKARVASMARKVDWFSFWLLNMQDPHPGKKAQYERWNRMKGDYSKIQ